MKKLILSAALVTMGTFAMAQQADKLPKDPAQFEQKRAEKLKTMQTDLGLSDAQVAQIKALQDKRMAERKAAEPQLQAERKAKMEEMKAKKQQNEAEMKQILTPEQFQKWQAQKQANMQERGKKFKDVQLKKVQAN